MASHEENGNGNGKNGVARWQWAAIIGLWALVAFALGQIYSDLRENDKRQAEYIEAIKLFAQETRDRQNQALIERKYFNEAMLRELKEIKDEQQRLMGRK